MDVKQVMSNKISDEQAMEILAQRQAGAFNPTSEAPQAPVPQADDDILNQPPPRAPRANAHDAVAAAIAEGGKEVEAPRSLGKATTFFQERDALSNDVQESGWKAVPMDQVPTKGLFYPDDATISIRAASVGEIRQWTTIDENDGFAVDDLLNFIVEKCVRMRFPGRVVQWQNLVEVDRLYLILSVRDMTFFKGENKLMMKMQCGACSKTDEVELGTFNREDPNRDPRTLGTIRYFKLPDEIMHEYYDADQKCFILKDENGRFLERIYIPTLGVSTFIKKFVQAHQRAGTVESIDMAFIRMAPFLFNDWRSINERTYNEKNVSTYDWDVNTLSYVSSFIDLIHEAYIPTVKHDCSECGAEVTAPVQFQRGIKSLFLIPNVFGKLLGA